LFEELADVKPWSEAKKDLEGLFDTCDDCFKTIE